MANLLEKEERMLLKTNMGGDSGDPAWINESSLLFINNGETSRYQLYWMDFELK